LWIAIFFGLVGFIMRKFSYEPAPLVMGFVLSGLIEGSFIRSLLESQGSFLIFFARPISLTLMILAFFLLLYPLVQRKALFRGKFGDD